MLSSRGPREEGRGGKQTPHPHIPSGKHGREAQPKQTRGSPQPGHGSVRTQTRHGGREQTEPIPAPTKPRCSEAAAPGPELTVEMAASRTTSLPQLTSSAGMKEQCRRLTRSEGRTRPWVCEEHNPGAAPAALPRPRGVPQRPPCLYPVDVGAQDEPPTRQLPRRLLVALDAAQQTAQRLVVLLGALQHLPHHVLRGRASRVRHSEPAWGTASPRGAAPQRQALPWGAVPTFSTRVSFLISEMPVRKVSSGSSSTMSSRGCGRAQLELRSTHGTPLFPPHPPSSSPCPPASASPWACGRAAAAPAPAL